MDDDDAPVTYPIPEATIAANPAFLAVLAAVIVGVLAFWRRKRRRA